MINLKELQWMSRCLTHPCDDALRMAIRAMDMFKQYPALVSRYPYLYVMTTKHLAR